VLFEQVIIETPPVNIHNDTLVISKLVDAVVLLCDLAVTESADLFETVQRFRIQGCVYKVLLSKIQKI
jgi:Mrp family chromosome partitioning ATPase